MKESGSPLMWAQATCAIELAIATPVASNTLPDSRYTPRNTIEEKKSDASLANTLFIVVSEGNW